MKKLPEPDKRGALSLEAAIAARRSVRSFSPEELSDEQISQLLWAAQGITAPHRGFRASPSAGATYPLETFIVMASGVFRYRPNEHALRQEKNADLREELCRAALGQPCVKQAPAVIVLAAVYERTSARYGQRAKRYVHMEAGHVAENIQLQAVAAGLGSVPVGAFDDDRVEKVLGLAWHEHALYLIPVGRPKA
ncbi:SagB/ThcOx family dehydrogenase [Verrucomicrobiota bacterium]